MGYKSVVVDNFGAYPVESDSVFSLSPKRKDGSWDRRTKLGKIAQKQYIENQDRRALAYFRER